MAPEQSGSQSLDARADLFSLGCVLYRMATGRPAFAGKTVMEILRSLAVDTPEPPSQVNPKIPVELGQLIEQLLGKDRDQRPASARAVVESLRAIESELARVSSHTTVALNVAAPVSSSNLAALPITPEVEFPAGDGLDAPVIP